MYIYVYNYTIKDFVNVYEHLHKNLRTATKFVFVKNL